MAQTATMQGPAFGKAEPADFPWWLMLIEGIAAIILGIFFFMTPAATTITVVWFIALYWVITGIIALVSLFWDRTQWGWKLFWGLISVAAGWYILTNILIGTATLLFVYVIILGIQGIVLGIVEVVQAFQGAGWGRGALGVISILFGALLLMWNWQVLPVLPWVFGAFAIIGGIAAIAAAFMLHRQPSSSQKAAMA